MRRFRTFSRWLLLIGCSVLLAGCNKAVPDPAKAGAAPAVKHTGAPLTEEDGQAFGENLENEVAAGDIEAVARLLRVNDLFARALSDLDLSAGEQKAMLAGAARVGKEFPTLLIDAVEQGGSYSLLRVRTNGGRLRVLVRMIHPDGAINYHEYTIVRYPDEAIAAEDIYIYTSGELISQSLRRLILGFMAGHAGLAKLNSEEQLLAKHLNDFTKLTSLVRSGQNKEALDTYRSLPAILQKNKSLQLIAIQAAGGTGDDDDYITEMEKFRTNHPNDPAGDLISIDYYLLKKDYDECVSAIERLDKTLGGDPYLDVIRATTLCEANKLSEARIFAENAIKNSPELSQAYWTRASIAAKEKNHDETLASLKLIVEKFQPTLNPDDLKADERFLEFATTTQFEELRMWLEQRSQ